MNRARTFATLMRYELDAMKQTLNGVCAAVNYAGAIVNPTYLEHLREIEQKLAKDIISTVSRLKAAEKDADRIDAEEASNATTDSTPVP